MAVSNKRYVWQTGKNLFEILNQLPNFGVGRIVTLGRWQHFTPERPSYYKITRVKLDCSKEVRIDSHIHSILDRNFSSLLIHFSTLTRLASIQLL